jgi:flagellar hook-length control protein FliK
MDTEPTQNDQPAITPTPEMPPAAPAVDLAGTAPAPAEASSPSEHATADPTPGPESTPDQPADVPGGQPKRAKGWWRKQVASVRTISASPTPSTEEPGAAPVDPAEPAVPATPAKAPKARKIYQMTSPESLDALAAASADPPPAPVPAPLANDAKPAKAPKPRKTYQMTSLESLEAAPETTPAPTPAAVARPSRPTRPPKVYVMTQASTLGSRTRIRQMTTAADLERMHQRPTPSAAPATVQMPLAVPRGKGPGMPLATRLVQEINRRHLSLRAAAVAIGVTVGALARTTAGKSLPNARTIRAYARWLRMNPTTLAATLRPVHTPSRNSVPPTARSTRGASSRKSATKSARKGASRPVKPARQTLSALERDRLCQRTHAASPDIRRILEAVLKAHGR